MTALLDMQDIVPEAIERANIPFGEWLPDAPALSNPGTPEALNVIPSEGSYAPFLQFEPGASSALPSAVRGAASWVLPDDTVQVFAGTATGAYSHFGGASVNTLIKSLATAGLDKVWKFIRVNDVVVLLHPRMFPEYVNFGTTGASVVVPGNPPKANCGAQVADFLMLGNLEVDPDDGNGKFPSRIRWGGYNNIGLPWVSDPITQADFQDMPTEGGPVIAIAGREVGTIYQARSISRATYRGLPSVFDIVTVEDKRGAIARDCIVDVGPFQFFIAEDGFFIWNGTNSTPIGDQKVNRYFFNALEYSERHRICGAVDFVNGCVMWAFPITAAGELDEIIIYSYRENKWSHSIQTLEYLFTSADSSIKLDDLTDILDSAYPISFDDPSYRGGGRTRLAAYDENGFYGKFTGPAMAAMVDTAEYSGPDGRRAFANAVRPIVDLAAPLATVQIGKRDQLIGEPLVFSDPVAQEIDGQCPIIDDARYMRFRLNLPEDAVWTHAVGIEVARKATGSF